MVAGGVAAAWPALPWVAAAAAALVCGLAAWRAPRTPAAPPVIVATHTGDGALRDPETGMFHRPAFLAMAERDWLRAGNPDWRPQFAATVKQRVLLFEDAAQNAPVVPEEDAQPIVG